MYINVRAELDWLHFLDKYTPIVTHPQTYNEREICSTIELGVASFVCKTIQLNKSNFAGHIIKKNYLPFVGC